MPRFYFDIIDGDRGPDEEGTELRNVVEARLEGVKFAGLYLNHRPDLVWAGSELRILVFDEPRTLLTTVLVSATDTTEMRQRIDAQKADAASPAVMPTSAPEPGARWV